MNPTRAFLAKLSLFISGVSLASTLGAAPLQNFYCGSRLVSIGANTAQLVQYCGQPTSVEQQTERVQVERYDEETGRNIKTYEDRPYQVWVYNFGPSRLVTRVRVEGNEVRQIESAGYGW